MKAPKDKKAAVRSTGPDGSKPPSAISSSKLNEKDSLRCRVDAVVARDDRIVGVADGDAVFFANWLMRRGGGLAACQFGFNFGKTKPKSGANRAPASRFPTLPGSASQSRTGRIIDF